MPRNVRLREYLAVWLKEKTTISDISIFFLRIFKKIFKDTNLLSQQHNYHKLLSFQFKILLLISVFNRLDMMKRTQGYNLTENYLWRTVVSN